MLGLTRVSFFPNYILVGTRGRDVSWKSLLSGKLAYDNNNFNEEVTAFVEAVSLLTIVRYDFFFNSTIHKGSNRVVKLLKMVISFYI